MTQQPKLRYLHVLYAEDVRMEVNQTHSIIGVYPGGLAAAAFPLQLSKLAVAATLVCPADDSFQSVVLEVVMGETVIHRAAPPAEFVQQSIADAASKSGHLPRHSLSMELLLSFRPPAIEQEGYITVRAIVDGEVIEGTPLRIESAPDTSNA